MHNKPLRVTAKVINPDGTSSIETFPMYRNTPKKTVSYLNRMQAGMGMSTRYKLVEDEPDNSTKM